MLGEHISDEQGIEGPPGGEPGLGLLSIETRLASSKTLVECAGRCRLTGESLSGYEMHIGDTRGSGTQHPMLDMPGHDQGSISEDGKVMGCYVHGLFSADGFRHAFLNRIKHRTHSGITYEHEIESTLDALALHLEHHLDLEAILEIARIGPRSSWSDTATPSAQPERLPQ